MKALKPELNKIFKPAFLGRLVIIPYYPMPDEAMQKIIELKLGKIQRRLQETHRVALTYDDACWRKWRGAAPKWKAARATWTTS